MPGFKFLVFLIFIENAGLDNPGLCQTHPVPASVMGQFTSMFPEAKNTEWRNKQTNFQVFFITDNSKCEAKFDLEGKWISTEKQINRDSLPRKIQDSLRSGRYADWSIQSVYAMRFPDKPVQYHIVITKDNLPNKILFVDQSGRLIKENPLL
jgi:hypothetical protein